MQTHLYEIDLLLAPLQELPCIHLTDLDIDLEKGNIVCDLILNWHTTHTYCNISIYLDTAGDCTVMFEPVRLCCVSYSELQVQKVKNISKIFIQFVQLLESNNYNATTNDLKPKKTYH